jgi:hypothetical protein
MQQPRAFAEGIEVKRLMSTQDRENSETRFWLFGLVAVTLIASLLAPALYVPELIGYPYFGKYADIVLLGWTALVYAVKSPAVFYLWVPNVALALGMILLLADRCREAMLCGIFGFGLAVANWLLVVNLFGNAGEFCKPLAGYYLWMASMAELAAASWFCARNRPKRRTRGVPAFLVGAMLGLVAGTCAIVTLVTPYAMLAGATTREWYVATKMAAALGAIVGSVMGGIVNVTISRKRTSV